MLQVFLQHLAALLSLEDFSSLWLQTLDFMDKYMHADNSELLLEAIPESLKNMLLVMSTAGIFKAPKAGEPENDPSVELWNMTWMRVNSFLPNLHGELFPNTPGSSPAPAPATGEWADYELDR